MSHKNSRSSISSAELLPCCPMTCLFPTTHSAADSGGSVSQPTAATAAAWITTAAVLTLILTT